MLSVVIDNFFIVNFIENIVEDYLVLNGLSVEIFEDIINFLVVNDDY